MELKITDKMIADDFAYLLSKYQSQANIDKALDMISSKNGKDKSN